MNSWNNRNSISTNKTCMSLSRKRERRKWKKSVSSGVDDSNYPARTFKNENTSGWITGPMWYWSNYQKALEWQSKIKNVEHAVHSIPHGTFIMTNDTEMEQESYENGEIEIEMSEEMKKFFEESIKHKMEMRRLKEKEKEEEEYDSINLQVKQILDTHDEREKEMKLLYGDGSSMIIGMETAVQLSFDKYCDLKSPKYWPNIPLKL